MNFKFKQFVNLCSDEEDDEIQEVHKNNMEENNNTTTITTTKKPNTSEERRSKVAERNLNPMKIADSDDDLEIVGIHYVKDSEKKKESLKTNSSLCKVAIKEFDCDKLSNDLFNKIDKFVEDDLKKKNFVHEPINYTYQEKDFSDISQDNSVSVESIIYQRRTTSDEVLFKRRSDFKDDIRKTEVDNNIERKISTETMQDFKDDEVEVQNLENTNNKNVYTNRPIEIISLDSCSDDDSPSSSKAAALKNVLKTKTDYKANRKNVTLKEKEKIIVEEISNSNCSNKKAEELLCESIDSVFSDMDEIMDELTDAKEKNEASTINYTNLAEEVVSECSSNKEKTIQPTEANSSERTVTLNREQIHKLLDDITNQKDFELDTFCAALSCVKQINNTTNKVKPNENNLPVTTPPLPPPPIVNNLPTPPVQPLQQQQQNISSVYPLNRPSHIAYLAQQQPQQVTPQLTPHYAQNFNFVHTSGVAPTPPPRPKVNINDPRIIKHLQAIKNSPLFSHYVLNSETASSIMEICQKQSQQLKQPNCQTSVTQPQSTVSNTMPLNAFSYSSNNDRKSSTAAKPNCITYGEYKRWKQEKNLETERKREEERLARAEKLEQQEKQELLRKNEQNIRSKLLSTLNPCREQLTTLWTQQKNSNSNQKENDAQKPPTIKEKDVLEANDSGEKENNTATSTKKQYKQPKNTKEGQTTQNKTNNNVEQKLNRVYNELKCTLKGFDCLNDYIPNVDEDSIGNSNGLGTVVTGEALLTPSPTGLRRRSSIYALSAISEQLAQQSSDCSDDSDLSQKKKSKSETAIDPKRRLTDTFNNFSTEIVSEDSTCSDSKRRKTIDEIIKPPKRRSKALRVIDDDTPTLSSADSSLSGDEVTPKSYKKSLVIKQPLIKLHRLSQEFIRKHTKSRREDTDLSPRLKKNCEKALSSVEPSQKSNKLKRYNNDCQMTERNTLFCVLCRSKPSDLTNHYIGRHKTESYVARLDWAELDDLQINTPFAKLQPKTKNYRFDRYEVECPFCKNKLLEPFMNLYHHYSAHTGEYAFQCSHCHLTKPYRPDIQSHILHSKTCRNSTTLVIYRYPPNTQCIYLHYCAICNFVQLNEANVLKHLREQHDQTKAIASNVQKCILVAMNDGPDVNETNKPPTPTPIPSTNVLPETTTTNRVEGIQANEGSNGITNNGVKSNLVNLPGEVKDLVSTTTMTTTTAELNFKVDDDDIPVNNEPCLEDDFLEEDKYCLEEHLKLLHERPSTPTPMTIIHCMGEYTKNTAGATKIPTRTVSNSLPPQSVKNLTTFNDRHLPITIKTENIDVEENLLITPPRQSSSYKVIQQTPQPIPQKNHPTIYEKYRSYPQNVKYLGLYKCMIDDCYYSTDCSTELCNHLTDHLAEEVKPIESLLQCPYCVIPMATVMTPQQLVEHVCTQHGNSIYQCSMCCYRSCDASNVQIHQQLCHNTVLNTCKIYKCSSEVEQSNKLKLDLNEIEKNIFKISCRVCFTEFYHSQLLINHLNNVHKVHKANNLKLYSCIYCPLTVENKSQIRIHVATKHPDELPRIYDHNAPCNNINEDAINFLNILNITETVVYEDINYTVENVMHVEDIKPNMEDLMNMQEETIKVRLRKLTAHTGVPPDNLYRCPVTTCGGFFSIFDLWLRHMKVRHHSLEYQCPHCPSASLLQLDQFAVHFEKHRRHIFICFHCPTTCTNETMARQHADQKHVDLGPMRFEKISFNLKYSYFIMLKSSLFEERANFIAGFQEVLDKRLKDLESNEIQKLKHQWPVQDNAEWLDDYLQILSKRRVVRTCLIRDCQFRTLYEDILFDHLRSSHDISGNSFNCSKCSFSVKLCTSFDEVFDHIRLHNDFICICTACSLSTSSRSKMCSHIQERHTARDVPVLELFKTNNQMFFKVYIVFGDNHLTFSTMKNCFCCSEKNMNGDVFSLHLKRYHKLSFTYYCEKCPNFKFTSLKDVKPHFQQHHSSDQFKIRCDLASPNNLSIISINDFQVKISIDDQTSLIATSSIHIKKEPIDISNNANANDDDDVILLEDNDIVIHEALKNEQLQQPKEIPKIKCASLSKLIETSKNTTFTMSSAQSFQPNVSPMSQGYYQPATSSTRLTASSVPKNVLKSTIYLNNNLATLQNNRNVSHSHTLNSMIAVPPPPYHTNSTATNLNTPTQHLPNNLYVNQIRVMQTPQNSNSLSRTIIITPNYTQNNI